MKKYILTLCALTCFVLTTNAQTKKETKAKTEKASKV